MCVVTLYLASLFYTFLVCVYKYWSRCACNKSNYLLIACFRSFFKTLGYKERY